jgi:hypothetical protein
VGDTEKLAQFEQKMNLQVDPTGLHKTVRLPRKRGDREAVYGRMHSTRTDSESRIMIPSPYEVIACSKSHEQHLPNIRPNLALSFVRFPEKLQVTCLLNNGMLCQDFRMELMAKTRQVGGADDVVSGHCQRW